MNSDPQIIIYSLAAGLSVFSLSLYFYSVYSDYITERLSARLQAEAGVESFAFRLLKPFARFFGHLLSAAIARMQQRWGSSSFFRHLTNLRVRLQRSLVAAGKPEGLSADDFLGLVCFSTLAWTFVGLVLSVMTGWSVPVPIAFVIGVAHPFHWLKRNLTRRQNEIRKLLPYSLDLLTLSVEAGLDFTSALSRMVPKLQGTALAAEFGELLRAIRLGKSRSEALREVADRVGMGEVNSFAGSLVQADELGADLGPVLRVLADQMRNDRSNRAEKKAMEAPVKILFPLIAFIFPTVFIIIFAPLGITYLRHLFGY